MLEPCCACRNRGGEAHLLGVHVLAGGAIIGLLFLCGSTQQQGIVVQDHVVIRKAISHEIMAIVSQRSIILVIFAYIWSGVGWRVRIFHMRSSDAAA
jgi:hypothetical protein